ncbi:MAG: CapA family protein, partial [Faecousia sp.]
MAENHSPKYRRRKKHSSSSPIVIGLVLVMAVLVLFSLGLRLLLNSGGSGGAVKVEAVEAETTAMEAAGEKSPSLWERLFGPKETQPPATEPPEPEHVVSTAQIAVTGDILMHMPVINTGLQSDGSYNFDSIFRYLTSYASAADYAVANLETTLCGTDKGYKYSGYPAFNCPDEIVDA